MPDNEREGAVKVAAGWARTVGALRDMQLQVAWMREQLGRIGAARAADVLTVVLARAEERSPSYATLLLRVSLALSAPELAALRHAIARLASLRAQSSLARFLGVAGDGEVAVEAVDPSAFEREDALTPERRGLEGNGERPLSLGERKSLARKRDRKLLARVLRDPHPEVVRIVLDNPAITEIDVVRLCARRPIAAGVLVQVFMHTRWIVRYRVRLALALSPYTPEPIALHLLPHLTQQDRREVARSGDVSARVRAACAVPESRILH